jgi:membrane protease YdiL (CAAX protease family)
MKFPLLKNTTTIGRIFIFAAMLVVFNIIATVVQSVTIAMGGSLSDLTTLRFAQISSQLLTFVFPPILFACLTQAKPMKYLGFNNIPLWSLIGIAIIYAVMPLNSFISEWNSQITLPESMAEFDKIIKQLAETVQAVLEKMVNVDTFGGLIINLIMIAGLAAFGEGLLFRSVLQPFLIRKCRNVHIGIIITSIIFSMIHFDIYGFFPRLILGMLLGYMFFYSRSIWVPMIMHFVNNATVVVLYYLNNIGATNIDVETFGQTKLLPLILSIIIMIALFWFVIRSHNKEFKTENTEI